MPCCVVLCCEECPVMDVRSVFRCVIRHETQAGWAPGPVWIGAEILVPQPGFNLRTVQPVASSYTD